MAPPAMKGTSLATLLVLVAAAYIAGPAEAALAFSLKGLKYDFKNLNPVLTSSSSLTCVNEGTVSFSAGGTAAISSSVPGTSMVGTGLGTCVGVSVEQHGPAVPRTAVYEESDDFVYFRSAPDAPI